MISIIRGPAGGGKSQWIAEHKRPGEFVADFTLLFAAVAAVTRGPDGKYPVREDGDPLLPLVSAVKAYVVRQAAARQLSGYVTTSDSRQSEIDRLRDAGADGPVETIDPGESVVAARLADPVTGGAVAAMPQGARQVVSR